MTDQTENRSRQFMHDVADIKRDSSSVNARNTRIGAALMVIGVGVAVVGFVLSQTTDNPLDQSSDISLGIAGLAVTLLGAAMFLRYSFAQFLRFWLLRFSYETNRPSQVSDRGGQGPGGEQ